MKKTEEHMILKNLKFKFPRRRHVICVLKVAWLINKVIKGILWIKINHNSIISEKIEKLTIAVHKIDTSFHKSSRIVLRK